MYKNLKKINVNFFFAKIKMDIAEHLSLTYRHSIGAIVYVKRWKYLRSVWWGKSPAIKRKFIFTTSARRQKLYCNCLFYFLLHVWVCVRAWFCLITLLLK